MASRFVLLPLVAALAGALTFGLHRAWDRWLRPGPVLVCPAAVDLGAQEHGATAVARLPIRNDGGRELVVDHFTTSCSCAGVERDDDGKPVRVESVRVPPGGTAELFVRVTVGAPVGGNQWLQIFFRTNDPARPVAQLDITVPLVTGGLYAAPGAVAFGRVPVGQPVQRVVELYDAGALGRRVAGARSLRPERFAVRVLPLAPGEGAASAGADRVLIARLEVTARTDAAGGLEGEIEIEATGEPRAPCRVPVTGEVSSAARCWPDRVVLPRRIDGRTAYSGEVLVTGGDGPIAVHPEAAPAWLRVEVREVAGRTDQRVVWVEGRPDRDRPTGDAPVRLRVRCGEGEETVTLPIVVAEAGR